ncbi:MAG: hypothetical protein HC850_00875 [Rhodomicrobium sp.]|nr:hypothetical protein [Rhodomicrobium sp.]
MDISGPSDSITVEAGTTWGLKLENINLISDKINQLPKAKRPRLEALLTLNVVAPSHPYAQASAPFTPPKVAVGPQQRFDQHGRILADFINPKVERLILQDTETLARKLGQGSRIIIDDHFSVPPEYVPIIAARHASEIKKSGKNAEQWVQDRLTGLLTKIHTIHQKIWRSNIDINVWRF